jgi:hypothetical protein
LKKLIAIIVIVFALVGFGVGHNGSAPAANHTIESIKQTMGNVTSGIQQTVSGNSSTVSESDAASVNLAALSYHSGSSAVVTVNHNQSTMNPNDWKTNKVIYSNLDTLNRTAQANTAYLAKRNVANDSLRVRQYIKPTGWHQKFSKGEAILNRGHLIAYSISKGISLDGVYNPGVQSGDQNNPKNLFTQTAFSNQEIQTIYESKVRTALKQGKKVIYQAQAIFKVNELMARGIHLQAVSTDGSLNFNVYIFNVQPDFQFDYANGTSKVDHSMSIPAPAGAPHFDH